MLQSRLEEEEEAEEKNANRNNVNLHNSVYPTFLRHDADDKHQVIVRTPDAFACTNHA